jgi:hypothetical protein
MCLKKKTDIKRTGNKQINAKEWEQLCDCLQGNSNPMITKILGKAQYFKLKIMQVWYKLFLGKIMLQLLCHNGLKLNRPSCTITNVI